MLNYSTINPLFIIIIIIIIILFFLGGGWGGGGLESVQKTRTRAKIAPREDVGVAGKFCACSRFLLALLS